MSAHAQMWPDRFCSGTDDLPQRQNTELLNVFIHTQQHPFGTGQIPDWFFLEILISSILS